MWRVINPRANSAFMNQAIVEALLESIGARRSPDTIRIYEWSPSSIAIGFNEKVEEVVNLAECLRRGVDIVRRPSGGGSVYLDEKGCFTYGVISSNLPKNTSESYSIVCKRIIEGLRNLGIEAVFRKPNDIIVNGRKISGNTQIFGKNVVMVSGTILYDLDVEKMFRVLKVDMEKMKKKGYNNPKESVTCIKDHANVKKNKVYSTLTKFLLDGEEFSFGNLTKEEKERSKFLEDTKYSTKEWNFRK